MPATTTFIDPAPLVYPESDGKPMADNTRQFRWIYVLFANLAALFMGDKEVFVGGNLMWYPVEGEPDIKEAPDVFAVFGRPKGDRRSYRQWEENNVPMTVAFEILSPGNDPWEMDNKLEFYEEHRVEEYYLYDPDKNRLKIFVRKGEAFIRVRRIQGFVSPRLGIRFDLSGPEMIVYRPDGERFLSFEELMTLRNQAEARAKQARVQADQARVQAEQAEAQANRAQARADQAEKRAERLAELSRKSRRGQATPEELRELENLEEPPAS